MRAYPAILEPLLFYVLHRVNVRLDESHADALTVCVMDEAWRFIQHDRLRGYVEEALKTWRKRNATMILATQTIEDFASADLLRTVVESCPTKLLLANPALDRRRYAELFQLNDAELDALTDLVARQQFLLKRPHLAKVLALRVDPASWPLYGLAQSADDASDAPCSEQDCQAPRSHSLEGEDSSTCVQRY
jgi:type IV secretion system protein TrbE